MTVLGAIQKRLMLAPAPNARSVVVVSIVRVTFPEKVEWVIVSVVPLDGHPPSSIWRAPAKPAVVDVQVLLRNVSESIVGVPVEHYLGYAVFLWSLPLLTLAGSIQKKKSPR